MAVAMYSTILLRGFGKILQVLTNIVNFSDFWKTLSFLEIPFYKKAIVQSLISWIFDVSSSIQNL
jgi:hypothetical protein